MMNARVVVVSAHGASGVIEGAQWASTLGAAAGAQAASTAVPAEAAQVPFPLSFLLSPPLPSSPPLLSLLHTHTHTHTHTL